MNEVGDQASGLIASTSISNNKSSRQMSQQAQITGIVRSAVFGRELVRPVVLADDLMQARIYRHLVPAEELRVAVSSRGMQCDSPRILSSAPVRIPVGGTAWVKINASGMADRFQLELSKPPEGVSIRSISPSRNGAEIELAADAQKAKPGQRGNLIVNTFANRPPEAGKPKGENIRASRSARCRQSPSRSFRSLEKRVFCPVCCLAAAAGTATSQMSRVSVAHRLYSHFLHRL